MADKSLSRTNDSYTASHSVRRGLLILALAGVVAWLGHTPTVAQDAPAEAAAAETEAAADTAAPVIEAAAGEPEVSGDPPAEESAAGEPAAEEEATEGTAEAAEEAAPAEQAGGSFSTVLTTLAVLVLPILAGWQLAKQWRLPEHGWKLALIFSSIAIAVLCVSVGEFKGGPDLSGGITLIYELADTTGDAPAQGGGESGGEEAEAEPEAEQSAEPKQRVDMPRLIDALKQRVDPTGTKEVSIRSFGGVIEVIIPKAGPDDLEFVKRRITDLGQLEFRITADPRWNEDRPIIEKALALGPSEKLVMVGDKPRAEWVVYDEREFSEQDGRLVQRTAGSRKEALVLLDRWNVTGEYLTLAAKGYDDVGSPAVDFTFNTSGARRFERFTGENLPNQATGQKRFLGILLDKRLISAPALNSQISGRGQISGGSMKEDEVDFIISILNAGSLPAALNKTPISEETVSPTLGATTIEKGRTAITVSLAAVLVFILFYYRFAGMVACLALAGTLLLVLAAMVVIQAAFTLPGLAGLVLTVGMAVDANVLIFERIREEMKKGAGLRMAIRNGFGRATTTIVDANVTTLIAAVVLYSVGTGPIKGFGVTLFLGIVMSMFTAIFCSRVLFDVAERKRWIKSLSFASVLGETNIDFIGKRHVAMVLSLAVIGAGLFGVFSRGTNLLNIDFTGGTSVTMVLTDDAKAEIGAVREALLETELADKNLLVVERGETNTRYTINSSLEDVGQVEGILSDTFSGKLMTYEVELGDAATYTAEGGATGTTVELSFNKSAGFSENDGVAHDALLERLKRITEAQGATGVLPQLENPDYQPGSSQRFKDWTLRLGLDEATTLAVAEGLRAELTSEPVFPLANKIGGRVASDMQVKGISAILLSLLGIVGYIWFRFQNVAFGLAAVVALVHDVLVTLGAIALSAWVVSGAGPLAEALQIDAFQISLPILAAFITIIGYSLNDTIVVFDRIREVRGKSPKITAETINKSVNQTLSRTLLTSLTTLIVVVILYLAGGAGIHAFAFALVVGVIVGTYSSIFVASPALLWLTGGGDSGSGSSSEPSKKAA